MMSVKYVKKYILGIKKHYKEFYSLIEKDYDYLSSDKTINLIIKIYEKIIQCGSLSKKFYGDFIKCCLYGLKNKELKLFSMCSNSLTAVPHILRDKIQYKKIFELKNFFSQISRDLRIKISYICILPDYDKKYNLNIF